MPSGVLKRLAVATASLATCVCQVDAVMAAIVHHMATRLGLFSLCLSSAVRTNGAFGSLVATVTTLAPSSRRPAANPIG